jgi:hypothetical protein
MTKTMKLRVVTYVTHVGRRWYVEREYPGIRIFGFQLTGGWCDVSSIIGYWDEATAKEFAEEYAKGAWVSDSATFTIGE